MRQQTVWMLVLFAILLLGCQPSTRVETRATKNAGEDTKNGGEDTKNGGQDKEQLADDVNVHLQKVSLAEYQQVIAAQTGKVVLVDFWATWCGPCVEQFPHTLELAGKHADQGLVVITMSCDKPDKEESVLSFLQRKNARIQNLLTDSGYSATFEQFDIRGGIPFYKLYDRQGKLRYEFGGDEARPDDNTEPFSQLDVRIQELLDE